jgi:hypothetical protein
MDVNSYLSLPFQIVTLIGFPLLSACGSAESQAPDQNYVPIVETSHHCSDAEFVATVNCAEIQGGWLMRCQGDLVYVDNMNSQQRCATATSTMPVCHVGGMGDEVVIARCDGGCADDDPRYFENFDDYLSTGPLIVCWQGRINGPNTTQ